jgi:DHA1 family bicyclomycin/chloramphenicol resistance-like MFS transporter
VSEPRARPPVPGYLIVFLGALVALGPLSMDAYLPAIPAMVEYFGSDIVHVNNTLSVFLIGYACGQFFGGATSDQIGRKRIGYLGLGIYIAATFAMAFVGTVEQLLFLRFVQAVGGGFSTVICMASVRDIYPVDELGKRFATVTMIVLVAPLVAPTLGSLLLPFGWQSIFLFKAAYATLLLSLYSVLVPETRQGHWRDASPMALFVQCGRVLSRRVDGVLLPIRYALAMALSASVLMTFVTNASFVYMQYFAVSPARFPFVFGLSVLGFMSMNVFSMKYLTARNAPVLFKTGLRIQLMGVGLLVAAVLLNLASIWVVVPLVVLTLSTLGLVGPSGSAQYMSFFTELAGSASSVYTTLMFSLGGLFGALVGLLYNGSLLPLAAVMASASVMANLLLLSVARHAARVAQQANAHES